MKNSKNIYIPVSNRLKTFCDERHITQKRLIDKGFGSAQTINNYVNGNTEPKANFLELFIKEFRVSAKWLMTGEGPVMENSIKYAETKENHSENSNEPEEKCTNPECNRKIIALYEKIQELSERLIALQDLELKKESNFKTGTY